MFLKASFESGLVHHVCLEPRADERGFEATAVGLSEGESFVLCHALDVFCTPSFQMSLMFICLLVLSPPLDFFVVDAEAHCSLVSLSFHTLSNHTPWSSGAPCTWEASKPWSCSALTARSHCVLCHRSMITPFFSRASVMYSGSSKHPSYPVRRTLRRRRVHFRAHPLHRSGHPLIRGRRFRTTHHTVVRVNRHTWCPSPRWSLGQGLRRRPSVIAT